MNPLIQNINNILSMEFPELEINEVESGKLVALEILNPHNARMGSLLIQTSEEQYIWLRNQFPGSAVLMNDIPELVNTILTIQNDKMFWAIGYKEENWIETMLCRKLTELKSEPHTTYEILFWSGKMDKTIVPQKI